MNLEGKKGAGEEFVFLNPVISRHKGSDEAEEGCLSIPGVYGDVIRPKQVRIQAYGIDGKEINVDLTGLAARCVQHEVDHLDGVLFFDRMTESGRGDLLDELYEFETEFQSKRATGEIPSDDAISLRCSELEQKYC
jgi:peptide deformylase